MNKPLFAALLLGAALVITAAGCSDDNEPAPDARTPDTGAPDIAAKDSGPGDTVSGPSEMNLDEELLDALVLRFLQGRTLGRLTIDSKDAAARDALVAFGKAITAKIPTDGSSPKTDTELEALVPLSNEIDGWEEDPADPNKGPLLETDPYAWINGGAVPFVDNGFEAVASETYIHTGSAWKLTLDLVKMSTTSGAEAAFKGAEWHQGTPP